MRADSCGRLTSLVAIRTGALTTSGGTETKAPLAFYMGHQTHPRGTHMIKPRNIDDDRRGDVPRTTIRFPKPAGDFDGWGPRLRN